MKSFVLVLFALLLPAMSSAQDLPAFVDSELPQLLSTYKELHQHPELSHQEKQTSALLADDLRKAGFTVTENVGKYEDGTQAYGLVAVMKNELRVSVPDEILARMSRASTAEAA